MDFVRRHKIMLTPEVSQRIGYKSIVTFHVQQMAAARKLFSIDPTNPVSPDMCERGRLAREGFENPVDVLRTAGADRTTPQEIPLEQNEEESRVITPHKGADASSSAAPAKVLGGDNARLLAMHRSISELINPFLASCGDQQDGSR